MTTVKPMQPSLGAKERDSVIWPFYEECFGDQEQSLKYSKMLNLGYEARLSLLSKILARCKPDEDGCLIWQGPDSGNGRGGGYGRFSFGGATVSVHRTVYSICYGPIPPRKQIDHECNKRRCCNPKCLQPVTHKKNQKLRDERSGK